MFNKFEEQLMELGKENDAIRERVQKIDLDQRLFNEKLAGFLKEGGLPDNFTLTQLALLAIRKSRG